MKYEKIVRLWASKDNGRQKEKHLLDHWISSTLCGSLYILPVLAVAAPSLLTTPRLHDIQEFSRTILFSLTL